MRVIGQCVRCGDCCKLAQKSPRCPCLFYKGDIAICTIHPDKPKGCKIYPKDNIVAFKKYRKRTPNCGFKFEGE